ncbi:hypothetical protein [Spirochaeta lutea]|nr:hypothetical protein [Spirochaeta lutea]
MVKSIGPFVLFVIVWLHFIPFQTYTESALPESQIRAASPLIQSDLESGIIVDSSGLQNFTAVHIQLPLITPRDGVRGLSLASGLSLARTIPLSSEGLQMPRSTSITAWTVDLGYSFNNIRLGIRPSANWARFSQTHLLFFYPGIRMYIQGDSTVSSPLGSFRISSGLFTGLQWQKTNGPGLRIGLTGGISLY